MSENIFDECVRQMPERSIAGIRNEGRIAGYEDAPEAVRYHVDEPLYTAVWVIRNAKEVERDYGPKHTHKFPELNILAGAPNELVYRILIGDEQKEVESPATILIPAGVPHSANLLKGSGSFVVMRFEPEKYEVWLPRTQNYGILGRHEN